MRHIGASSPLFSDRDQMPVNFQQLEDTLEFVDFNGGGYNEAFVCRQTGKIYWRSDVVDDLDVLPDDIEDTGKYVSVPSKRNLGLGKPLALDFARDHLPNDYADVRDIFDRRGAFGKFEALLRRRGAMERWYKFRNEATLAALREWCEDNGLDVAG